jgi:hypothetical protein
MHERVWHISATHHGNWFQHDIWHTSGIHLADWDLGKQGPLTQMKTQLSFHLGCSPMRSCEIQTPGGLCVFKQNGVPLLNPDFLSTLSFFSRSFLRTPSAYTTMAKGGRDKKSSKGKSIKQSDLFDRLYAIQRWPLNTIKIGSWSFDRERGQRWLLTLPFYWISRAFG